MKSFRVFLVFISFYAFAKAQNTPSTITEVPLEFVLGVGEHQKINDVEITFLKVLEDSRCPSDVDCVWAGEAKIKVLIKEKNENSIEKVLILGASRKGAIIYSSEEIRIKAVRLSPYPTSSISKKSLEYYLEIRA